MRELRIDESVLRDLHRSSYAGAIIFSLISVFLFWVHDLRGHLGPGEVLLSLSPATFGIAVAVVSLRSVRRARALRVLVDRDGITLDEGGSQKRLAWHDVAKVRTTPSGQALDLVSLGDAVVIRISLHLERFMELVEALLHLAPALSERVELDGVVSMPFSKSPAVVGAFFISFVALALAFLFPDFAINVLSLAAVVVLLAFWLRETSIAVSSTEIVIRAGLRSRSIPLAKVEKVVLRSPEPDPMMPHVKRLQLEALSTRGKNLLRLSASEVDIFRLFLEIKGRLQDQ